MELSPLDGRYAHRVERFAKAFSEEALMRWRFTVEVEWLRCLAAEPDIEELLPLTPDVEAALKGWVSSFGPADFARIRAIEAVTNHDVKAVEYCLKEKLTGAGYGVYSEFVHFGCTSEDINNLAHSLMLRDGLATAWLPNADALSEELSALAVANAGLPMLGHTHGQPATPTTLGKELAVFVSRWRRQLSQVRDAQLLGKFNGAVGTYAAHMAAYPEVGWVDLTRRFVESFGLVWNPLTTQIEPHDALAEVFHALSRYNAILIDFCRDTWEYISRGYLRQRAFAGEVGSSTMPHKVNPIDFENAEANAGISSALLEHLASKLAVSRLQRDLSDSSALRNMGVAIAHSGLAIQSARRGLARVEPDREAMAADLDQEWEVLAEAVQTVMRRYGLEEPYEQLKRLTQGASVGADEMRAFVRGLGLPEEAEARLLALTPATYTGLAAELVAFAVPPEAVRPA
ncbi:MAG: adenylosuccinate lyase [Acidimicrobiales bacterium]